MAKKKAVAEELKAPAVKGLLRDVPDPTVYLNGVLRFDDDHIIRVKYDPTSKAMVIDDVPQSLESSITLGEGGGGSIENPLLTVKVVNSKESDSVWFRYYAIEDETLKEKFLKVEHGQNDTCTATLPYSENDEVYYLDVNLAAMGESISITETVNCSEDDGNVVITDPSVAASCTITYLGLG